MADTLALDHVYNTVTAAYTAEGDTTPHYFGWEEVPKQLKSRARILWVPGDPGGKVGQIVAPRGPSGLLARPLANLQEAFHVYIHGFDATDPKDERLQWRAVRFAFDTFFRHLYGAGHGILTQTDLTWNPGTKPQEFRHGATILWVGAILSVIPDTQSIDAAPIDGTLTLDVLDAQDTIVVDNGVAP